MKEGRVVNPNNPRMKSTVPCSTCGAPTIYQQTQKCDRCWEVERLLPGYIKNPQGREHIMRLLGAERS